MKRILFALLVITLCCTSCAGQQKKETSVETNELSDEWVNGYDKGQILTNELHYDLSAIPSFYLLDKDKKVLLKDADWRQVLHFFEK